METLKHIAGFIGSLIYCITYIFSMFYFFSCIVGWMSFTYKTAFYILLILNVSKTLMNIDNGV